MKHAAIAKALGIGHSTIHLIKSDAGWSAPPPGRFTTLEEAALTHYRKQGWHGYAQEGGLILNLIKAPSFEMISLRNRSTYIEALYAQNVAFEQDRYKPCELLECVRNCSEQQILANFRVMASRRVVTERYGNITSRSSTSMLDFFPTLKLDHFRGLFRALGPESLYRVATAFAIDPYEYRKGWPDLTLWRDDEVSFREVKAPRDTLRPSQRKVISEILKPLGFHVEIVDVQPQP